MHGFIWKINNCKYKNIHLQGFENLAGINNRNENDGEFWGYLSDGKSAFWNNKGELVSQMNDSDSGLLLVENQNDNWASQIIK
ncbi:hypothetical protein ACM55K_07905 [Flavobacterium sp. LT1R49]|uniref:hypothetical protein n=1 Tax=Flavobacterium arabinosi TaxID=3398737 RepID=UPI003A84834E